ncbi:MAG TPA: SAM-dependent methyltransferase [Pyrinomonadaceae bacterium]|jgi:SAM-dependent MidA family methyltransferase
MTDPAPLAARLRARITRAGPLTCHEWMTAALYDEHAGYYNRADLARWGRAGDYRTSPERSPLFAATCARYFAQLYAELGAPDQWTIIEAGAGRGDFAKGVLTTFEREHPDIYAATRYVLDEQSADARARTRAHLVAFAERIEFRPLAEIGAPVGLVFANELLDALPVHRVVARGGELRELCVGLNAAGEFVWVECAPSTPHLAEYFARLHVSLAEGQTAEVNLAADDWLARAAGALTSGYLIVIDYGADAPALYDAAQRPAGTLRAFHRHQLQADVLARPGAQDLTTTINWTQIKLAAAANGLQPVLCARQDEFLMRAGLLAQLESMSARLESEAERTALRLSAREMILPGGMSQSFQVLVWRK